MGKLPDRRYIFSTGQIRSTYGGLTIAMMRRAKLFAENGNPVDITTIDWWLGYSELSEYWKSNGLMPEGVRIRNIHEDFSSFDSWPLESAIRNAEPSALIIPHGFRMHEHPADDGRKRYWYAPGENKLHAFTEYLRSDGSVYMRTLSNPGASEWGRPYRPVGIYDRDGVFRFGFPSHYHWWVFWAKKLISEDERPPFVIQDIEDEQFFSLWKSAGAASVQFVHLSHTKTNSRYGQLKDRWYSVLRRECPFRAVVIPTHWQAVEWRERFGDETGIFVVPHFNINWPERLPALAEREHRVLIVSRLVPEKRVDEAIRIFARAANECTDAVLHIHGDGPERSKLEALVGEIGISSQVVFHGHSPDGASEFSKARAALFTSKAEGFGLTILEAMANGAVPIAYNVRYGPSGMINSANGYLVNDLDVEEAGKSLVEVLVRDDLATRLSDSAVKSASSFTGENTLAAWREVVEASESWSSSSEWKMF
ncbi:glycosyltransferase [Brevibacterium epidermidis]|uniref:glycosyltransferase n=1 Tax=Brevibacterium epidermidis TaxID=1698 RepID=UPI000BF290FF|nr:glycosyltransferase [Brevibacterium epidermidis]